MKELKKLLRTLFFLMISVIVFLEIYWISFSTIGLIYTLTSHRPPLIPRLLFFIFSLFPLVTGIIVGIWSIKKRGLFYKIFRPEREKLIFNFILTILFSLYLIFTKYSIIIFLKPIPFSFTAIILFIIGYFVYFYPFSSLLQYGMKRVKKKQRITLLVFLGIVILNPIFLISSQNFYGVIHIITWYEPCGVRIGSFLNNSPLLEAGAEKGEVIKIVNNYSIRTIGDLSSVIESLDPRENLTIITDKGIYKVKLRYYEKYKKYMLGITNLSHELCLKKD